MNALDEQEVRRSEDQWTSTISGVFDTVGADERFGEARLISALSGTASEQEAFNRIAEALNAFQIDTSGDDTAVVAIERLAAGRSHLPMVIG